MINQGDMDETNQKIQSWRSRAGEFGELAVIPRELCMEKAGVNEVRGSLPHVFANYFVKVERKGRHQILFARACGSRVRSTVFGQMGWNGKTCVPKNAKNVPSENRLTVRRR
jgi:hypothetical protein